MSVAASLNAIQVHPVLVAALPGDNSVTVIFGDKFGDIRRYSVFISVKLVTVRCR